MLATFDGTEFVTSLDRFFCKCAESEQLRRCLRESRISLKWVFLPNGMGGVFECDFAYR